MRFVKSTIHQPTPAAAGAGGGAAAPTPAAAEPEERILTFGDVFGRDAGGLIVLLVLFGGMTLASNEFLTARQHGQPGPPGRGVRDHRGRPAAGDPHGGHRPLGRLRARPHRLHHGRAARPRHRDRPRHPRRDGRRRRDRRLQRLARRLRQAAAVHRHARHARHRARGGARAHRREHRPTAAGRVRQHRQRRLPRPAEPPVDVRRGRRDRVVRAAADRLRPLRLRGRLEPGVRASGRRAGRRACSSPCTRSRACWPRSAACCSRRA